MCVKGVVKITETECYDCDYAENCDWNVMLANNTCDSPPCTAKAWHDKSRKTFDEMKHTLRVKLTKVSPPLGFKGVDQTDEGWT